MKHRSNYTKAELTDMLIGLADELGRTPTAREVDKSRSTASMQAFKTVFGTQKYNDVLRAVGLTPNLTKRVRSKQELGLQLVQFAEELGRTPTMAEVRRNPDLASDSTYMNIYGETWNNILKEVGLSPTRVIDRSTPQLLDELRMFASILGHTPTIKEMSRSHEVATVGTYENRFGMPWREVVQIAGLIPNRRG